MSVLDRIGAGQAGYLTMTQMRQVGIEEFRRSVADGAVVRVDRRLFRLSGWPVGDLDEFAEWCARFEGAAAVSHHSAACLHGFGSLKPRYLHMISATAVHSEAPGLAVHRSALAAADVESAGSFTITTPLRTVLDLAECGISQGLLDEVVTDAIAIDRLDRDVLSVAASARTSRVAARVHRALAAVDQR